MAKSDDSSKDADILATAKQRFDYALSASSHNRERAKADIRFAAASPDDPWQWDQKTVQNRGTRPMLTINKMPQHIRQVTNDIRQNRPSIRFRPADSKADPEVADILMGLVRHIEANSDADIAYDTAADHEVTHGLGYIRVLADYVSDKSFDQDIFIGRVKNPYRCYEDPDIEDPAGSDRRWFFVEEVISEDDFKVQYPDCDPIDWAFVDGSGDWFNSGEKKVRVCEYFEVVDKPATLCLWQNGSVSFKGEPPPEGVFIGEKPLKERKTVKKVVLWRKITGQEILDTKEFPSKYIPFARVVGNEWEVDGKTYISGLVRNAKDSQRMYNVAQTAIVERVMQAPKSPWLAPAEAIEGYEPQWQTANTANHSFLPYNHKDENGDPVPTPSRVQPATVETGLSQVAAGAADDIKSETGQYDASLGQRSNETSGKAIMARQREGDTATYHYVDNLARGVRHVGRIILDMIPQIYDQRRIARILGEDGNAANATLDPSQPQALNEFEDDEGAMQRVFNPTVGTYDVYSTTGPSFTTRRVEAVEAMTQMTQANPQLWQVIGDQLVKQMDWPGAEDMAERLKLTLLPEVREMANKDDKPADIPPQIKQAMDQMHQQGQQLSHALELATADVEKLESELQAKDGQILQAQAKAVKLEIDLREEQSLRAIEEAEQQALEHVQAAQSQLQPPAPPDDDGRKLELERYRIDADRDAKIKVARIQHLGKVDEAEEPYTDEPYAETQEDKPDQVALAIAMLAEHMSRPKQVIRDEAGRVVGIQ